MDDSAGAGARQGGAGDPEFLILAVADYADDSSRPCPPELQKAWNCARWRTLPRAGGLDDQPIRTMNAMNAALNVHAAMTAYATAEASGTMDEKWMEAHRGEMRIWSKVQILRTNHARI